MKDEIRRPSRMFHFVIRNIGKGNEDGKSNVRSYVTYTYSLTSCTVVYLNSNLNFVQVGNQILKFTEIRQTRLFRPAIS